MSYTQKQLKIIGDLFPSLRKLPTPSIDTLILAFLKKYNVDVDPLTSKTAQQAKENWVDTSITLMAGPSLGYEATELTKLKQQTKIQEWTQWKQWALDHKDFPAFKVTALEKIKKHNEDREKKFLDTEFLKKKVEPKLKAYKNNATVVYAIFGVVSVILCVLYVLAATSDSEDWKDSKQSYPTLSKDFIIS